MRICAYRGKSWVSRLIQLQSFSAYSHIAILDDDQGGVVYEAWQDGGCLCNAHLGSRHSPGTPVDIFSFISPLTETEKEVARTWMRSQLGKKYDFRAILRFLIRKNSAGNPNAIICSEYAFVAAMEGNRELLSRVESWRVSPAMIVISPLLKYDQTVVTSKDSTLIPPLWEPSAETVPPPAAIAVKSEPRYEPATVS